MTEYEKYIKENPNIIKYLVRALSKNNRDYTTEEIKTMVLTATWEIKKKTVKGIYMMVLNRILEEKGLKYLKGKLFSPMVSNTEFIGISGDISPTTSSALARQEETYKKLDTVFEIAGLNSEEVLVMVLRGGFSQSSFIEEKYQKRIEKMDELYYLRGLTIAETSSFTKKTNNEVAAIEKRARIKLDNFTKKAIASKKKIKERLKRMGIDESFKVCRSV